jgi:hypothetical protein
VRISFSRFRYFTFFHVHHTGQGLPKAVTSLVSTGATRKTRRFDGTDRTDDRDSRNNARCFPPFFSFRSFDPTIRARTFTRVNFTRRKPLPPSLYRQLVSQNKKYLVAVRLLESLHASSYVTRRSVTRVRNARTVSYVMLCNMHTRLNNFARREAALIAYENGARFLSAHSAISKGQPESTIDRETDLLIYRYRIHIGLSSNPSSAHPRKVREEKTQRRSPRSS